MSWLLWFYKCCSGLLVIVLDIGSEAHIEPMSFFGGGGASVMDSQFEFDWDRLMNHSYVWDLLLIRLSLRERKETATD